MTEQRVARTYPTNYLSNNKTTENLEVLLKAGYKVVLSNKLEDGKHSVIEYIVEKSY